MKKFLPLLAVFVLCFSLCVPASAAVNEQYMALMPSFDGIWDKTAYPYAYLIQNDHVKETSSDSLVLVLCSEKPSYEDLSGSSTNLTGSFTGGGNFQEYWWYLGTDAPSGEDWTMRYSNSSGGGRINHIGLQSNTSNMWYSTVLDMNFEFDEGSPAPEVSNKYGFFPIPLPEIVQGVTTETLTETTVPALGQTASTVVLCGVGCLALLMVLVLFGKRSQIFHI